MHSVRHGFLSLPLMLLLVTGCNAPPTAGGTPAGETTKADSDSKTADASKTQASAPSKGETPAKPAAAKQEEEDKAKAKEEKEKKEKEEKIKKFTETLENEDYTTVKGLFTLLHDNHKILLHLDEESLGREFLYVSALNSGVGTSSLYRGALLEDTDQVLRFEKRNDSKIVIVAQPTRYVEPGDSFDARRLAESTSESIIRIFDIVAEHPDEGRYFVDLGAWFIGDNLGLAKSVGGKYSVSKDLTEFAMVNAFPQNIEIGMDMVLVGSKGGGTLAMADSRGFEVKVRHSFCALPGPGFKSRPYDQRVGYFVTERKDLFAWDAKDPVHRFANRWRLQKKDPTADVSEPVEPITYWIENSTPKKWRDAVRKGIEGWEPAFRKAGFANGIVAKQMPDDADWDPADVRYAVVRWSTDENVGFAIGPSRVDPRTGEIFDADITMQESFLSSYARRFDTLIDDLSGMSKEQIRREADAMFAPKNLQDFDPSALQQCRMTTTERGAEIARAAAVVSILNEEFDRDAFLSEMLTDVIMHEVGHTLGMRHNFRSSTYNDKARSHDAAFTAQHGLAGSVMDYNAINIAAPGETQGEYFPSCVGPYDMWTIEYGYTEIQGNEEKTLEAIASRSHEEGLDYGTDEDSYLGDPMTTTWDFGTDPIAFAADQVALAKKGFSVLTERGAEEGEAFYEYSRFYSMFSSGHRRALSPLGSYLGAYQMNRDLVGQEGGRPPIVPVDGEMQSRALDLLIEEGLGWTGGVPTAEHKLMANKKVGSWGRWFDPWSFDPVRRDINLVRYRALSSLLNTYLLERVANQHHLGDQAGPSIYAIADRTQNAVWSQSPDENDRWTQKDYVDMVMNNLDRDGTPDVTALMDGLLTGALGYCRQYATNDNPAIQAHGSWLAGHIERFRNRQGVESF